jgi:hypothetical protein
MDIKMQQFTAREIRSQKFANKSELRLKWLRQKVEKISQKVRRSQPVKLIEQDGSITHPNYNIHIFYYAWYGNVAVDGHWRHWNHEYLPNWKKEDRKIYPTGMHEPPGDISSNFYPLLGCYSSSDPTVIDTHMKQLSSTNVGMYLESTVGKNKLRRMSITDLCTMTSYDVLCFHVRLAFKQSCMHNEVMCIAVLTVTRGHKI